MKILLAIRLNLKGSFIAQWSQEGVKLNQGKCCFFAGFKCIPESTTSCGQIIFQQENKVQQHFSVYFSCLVSCFLSYIL